jgi:hypothetical protein
MAPKKAGGKKADVVDLPKASTLPDGQRNFFVGGWSSNADLTSITTISEIVKPATEEAEATAPQINIMVLPGALKHADSAVVMLTHGLNIKGLLPQQQAANKAAYEAKRNPKDQGGDAEDVANNAAEAEEGGKQEKPQRKVLLANDAVQIHGGISFNGIKPPIVVVPVIEQEKKSAVPEKGAKKKTDEDRAREAEAQRQREENAIRIAKEEEERLSKFAIPRRWPTVTIANLSFFGPVSVAGAHINFINCNFLTLGGGSGPLATNQVEVNQYCKVSFTGCTFAQPSRNALYVFPLADVTARNCVFSGVDQPHSVKDLAAVQEAGGPSAAAVDNARASRPDAVGVHADSAKVVIDDCLFEALGTGVILRGRYALAPAVAAPAAGEGAEKSAGGAPSAKIPTSMTVQKSEIKGIFGTGIFIDRASGVSVQGNNVVQCEYYGAQLRGAGRVQVIRNSFANTVLVHEGAAPFLHTNNMAVPLLDKNDKGNVYMEPTY